jgi:GxxExxY protein
VLRITSPLPEQTENLIHRVIGRAINIHKELGSGYPERAYSKAMALELDAGGIPYQREKPIQVLYRGRSVCDFRLDLVIAEVLIVEIKCVDRFKSVHHAQVRGYLRAAGLRAGLLLNFKVGAMPDGIKRVVL